jgi:hypothetical protein
MGSLRLLEREALAKKRKISVFNIFKQPHQRTMQAILTLAASQDLLIRTRKLRGPKTMMKKPE